VDKVENIRFASGKGELKIYCGYGTGDPELDDMLGNVDRAARQRVGGVARKIGRENDLPPEMVDWMLNKVGMSPGDAYLAAKVAKVSRRSVEDVVAVYRQNRGKGWGAIAIAKSIKGVTSVSTYLLDKRASTVGKSVDDVAITAKVKARMIKDKEMKATQIRVKTVLGHVVLLGIVGSQKDANKAIRYA
jgi:BON domain